MLLEPRGRSIKRAGISGTEDVQACVEYACVTERKAGGTERDGPHSRLTSEQGRVYDEREKESPWSRASRRTMT